VRHNQKRNNKHCNEMTHALTRPSPVHGTHQCTRCLGFGCHSVEHPQMKIITID
jgi:hypothetical protein